MSKTFCHVLHLILSQKGVDKYFVGFCSEGYESSCWADLNREALIGVIDLCYWPSFITVPEEDWSSLAASYKFEFIIFSLRHAIESAILGLMAIHTFFLLEIVSRDGSIHGARVNQMWLVDVWEEADNLFLLV